MEREEALRYLGLAREAERELMGPRAREWTERLDEEHGNVEAALQCFLANDPRQGLELAAALRSFWGTTGRFEEGRRWLDQLLAATVADGPSGVRAKALSAAGILAFRQSENEEASRLNEEALAIAREMKDLERIVDALVGLARVGLRDGNLERTRAVSEEGRAIARAGGNRDLERLPLHCLAEATRMSGDYHRARQLYQESVELNRELGVTAVVAVEHSNLAAVELHEGNLEEATQLWRDSLGWAHAHHDLYLLPYCVMGLGEVACAAERFEEAALLLGAATGIFESTGQTIDPADRGTYEQSIAQARAGLGDNAFEIAWDVGKGWSVEQAVEHALRERV